MTLAVLTPQLLHDSRLEAKLLRELGVVGPLLKEVGVEDVVLNPDNKLWCKRAGSPMAFHSMFSPAQASALLATIAHICGHTLNEEHPVLETVLPYDGSRIQGLIPPIVAAPSFAIRTRPTTVFTLADYVAAGILSASNRKAIEAAIAARKNILTVGGTGSGKTTLSNALLDSMAKLTPHHRVAIIEDTGELKCEVANSISLLASRSITMNDCLRSCMRLSPDRIIVGEVRGPESLELIKAWNTGHPGGVATIHANSARGGLRRMERLVEEATAAPKQEDIAEAVNMLIFISKDLTVKAGRRVQEVLEVVGFDRDAMAYQCVEVP